MYIHSLAARTSLLDFCMQLMNCNILVAISAFNWILKIYMLLFKFGTNINGEKARFIYINVNCMGNCVPVRKADGTIMVVGFEPRERNNTSYARQATQIKCCMM